MTTDAQRAERLRAGMFNLPNQLTMLRVLLSVVMFCFIVAGWYWTSFWLFVVAAGTDWVDGYFARNFGQVTALGRILDPFADKVIVCGTLILLVAIPAMSAVPWGLRAWMVVVVVGRELLVTTLRSFIEERGGGFLGEDVGQAENGVAVSRRRGVPVLSLLPGEDPGPVLVLVAVGGLRVVGRGFDGLLRRRVRSRRGEAAGGAAERLGIGD